MFTDLLSDKNNNMQYYFVDKLRPKSISRNLLKVTNLCKSLTYKILSVSKIIYLKSNLLRFIINCENNNNLICY